MCKHGAVNLKCRMGGRGYAAGCRLYLIADWLMWIVGVAKDVF